MDPETNHSIRDEESEPEKPGEAGSVSADSTLYREVDFEMLPKALYPPHPEPPEVHDDELTQAALGDPDAESLRHQETGPTLWRIIVLISFAVIALGIVFLWHK